MIQQFLARAFPDFIIQGRQKAGKRLHITLERVGGGASYHIKVAAHFVEHHQAAIEIETFLEHHALTEKVHHAGARVVIIDNTGVHFGPAER